MNVNPNTNVNDEWKKKKKKKLINQELEKRIEIFKFWLVERNQVSIEKFSRNFWLVEHQSGIDRIR